MREWRDVQARFPAILLLAAWMGVIFYMSAQPAGRSSQMSLTIGMWVGKVFCRGFAAWPEAERLAFAMGIEIFVRKSAHAFEYAVLGGLMMNALRRDRLAAAWALGTLYAVTDEVHQRFVPGRSGQLSDVLLDSAGVAVGAALCYGLLLAVGRYRRVRAACGPAGREDGA